MLPFPREVQMAAASDRLARSVRLGTSPSAAADGAAGESSMPSSGHRLFTGHVFLWLLVFSLK